MLTILAADQGLFIFSSVLQTNPVQRASNLCELVKTTNLLLECILN